MTFLALLAGLIGGFVFGLWVGARVCEVKQSQLEKLEDDLADAHQTLDETETMARDIQAQLEAKLS